ncbi:MAG: LVIVD repeat-containing protein, partial [Candidatus Heimdallarchaeaceae archaeon]
MKKNNKIAFCATIAIFLFIFASSFSVNGDNESIEEIRGIVIQDTFAYAFSRNLFIVLDVSSPENITEVSAIVLDSSILGGLCVVNNSVYVVSSDLFTIIDVSNKSNPLIVSQVALPSSYQAVSVEGNYAYLAGGGLQIVNITNPEQPYLLTTFQFHHTDDIYVYSNFAYVVGYYDGLRILDVSNPSNPVILGDISTTYISTNVYVEGNYSYVLCEQLWIIDCSDKNNLT